MQTVLPMFPKTHILAANSYELEIICLLYLLAPVIKELLGHSTLAMTLHYLRNITPDDEVLSQVTEVLSKSAYTCIQ